MSDKVLGFKGHREVVSASNIFSDGFVPTFLFEVQIQLITPCEQINSNHRISEFFSPSEPKRCGQGIKLNLTIFFKINRRNMVPHFVALGL